MYRENTIFSNNTSAVSGKIMEVGTLFADFAVEYWGTSDVHPFIGVGLCAIVRMRLTLQITKQHFLSFKCSEVNLVKNTNLYSESRSNDYCRKSGNILRVKTRNKRR